MANVKKMVDDTLGTINAALTILDKYPQLVEGEGNLRVGVTVSPFSFLAEILKNYGGYKYFVDILSDFIFFGTAQLEVAIKTYLLINLQNLFTCSLNPIIPNELLRYGMVFDLREIDIFNTLAVSPLDYTYGQYYYFGCEDANTPEELRRSQDFNAVLWYLVNRSNCRELWTVCNSGQSDKILGSWQGFSFNGRLGRNLVPLKDVSCVDIVVEGDTNEKNLVTCRWDSSKVEEYDGDTQGGSIKEYFQECKVTENKIEKYYTVINHDDEGYYFVLENDEKHYLQENEIIYDCELTEKCCVKIINEKEKYSNLEVKKGTIAKREGVSCGLIDEILKDIFIINDEENYIVHHENNIYYRCNEGGIIINSNNDKVQFERRIKFKIKKNLITGQFKTKTVSYYSVNNKAGIITLEYHEHGSSIIDAEGYPLLNSHVPNNNCLHVFLGNTQPSNYGDILQYRNKIVEEEKNISNFETEIKILEKSIEDNIKKIEKCKDNIKKYQKEDNKKNEIDKEEDNIKQYQIINEQHQDSIKGRRTKQLESETILTSYRSAINNCNKTYRDYTSNYYYKRTLLEFCNDYIWSLKLYDAKVLTAQLLDLMFNYTTINLNLSYERKLTTKILEDIVKGVIETDDAEVNDCFFKFTNEGYNNLLIQSEKIYQGLYSTHPNQEGVKVDINAIMGQLNNISEAATAEEQHTIIKGVIRDITSSITNYKYDETDDINLSIGDKDNVSGLEQMGQNLIENLLNNLATALCFIILSPKVYLLIAIVMRIMGEQTNMDVETIIQRMKKLLVGLIRIIRDKLLEYITERVMEIVNNLATEIGNRISIEQAMYYYNIIRRLIDCFKNRSQVIGFTMDAIGYADIYKQESTPPTTEC